MSTSNKRTTQGCYRCSFLDKPSPECIACKGTNIIEYPSYMCVKCKGKGDKCKVCNDKGYTTRKMNICPLCAGEPKQPPCSKCSGNMVILAIGRRFQSMVDVNPKQPKVSDMKQKKEIFFPNCNHFNSLEEGHLDNGCYCCRERDNETNKGLYCASCNISICSKCLNNITNDYLLDDDKHSMITVKNVIQKCRKCKIVNEDIVTFYCEKCDSHLCGSCLKANMSISEALQRFKSSKAIETPVVSEFKPKASNKDVKPNKTMQNSRYDDNDE